MNNIPKRLSHLSPEEKRKLLAQLLRKKAAQHTTSYPLSYGQKALWLLYQRAPESSAYNVGFAARIRGACDALVIRRSFEKLMARHAALRTTFHIKDEEPIQVVHGHRELDFELIEASDWNEAELKQRVQEAYERPFDLEEGPVVRLRLFRLSAEAHVLLLSAHHIVGDAWSQWMLLDEWRQLYMVEPSPPNRWRVSPRERGRTPTPPAPVAYADFVRWQEQMINGAEGERLWRYWQEQLGGIANDDQDRNQDQTAFVLDLPTDYARPPTQRFRGASHPFQLSEELTAQLKQLTQAEGATLNMTLLAAFQLLLHRYTGQNEILVGSPTSGRSQAQFAQTVGYFVNPVVLRADFSTSTGDSPSFLALLAQVRQTVLGAMAHQAYPFSLLVERLGIKRDPSRTPIFQTTFTFQKAQQSGELMTLLLANEQETSVQWGGLELLPFELAQQEGQFDLSLEVIEVNNVLVGRFEYSTDLFEAATIARMTTHFETLLSAIVTTPNAKVADLPLLTPNEQHQLLVEWNNTARPFPDAQKTGHQLFEEQAARTPDAIAVVEPQPSRACLPVRANLTYSELNRRANQLAHYLIAQGVSSQKIGVLRFVSPWGKPTRAKPPRALRECEASPWETSEVLECEASPWETSEVFAERVIIEQVPQGVESEVLVGICLERGVDMVVSVLAVLKAGGAYVPLDAQLPPERLAYMVSDAQIGLLLTSEGLRERFASVSHGMQVLCLDSESDHIAQQPTYSPTLSVLPQQLAYVIYTSGSTGAPKGVMVTHANLLNAYWAWEEAYQLRECTTSHLQMASFSFDVFSGDLVRALCSGGKLVLCPKEWLLQPERLYGLMRAEQIDCAEFVPAVARALIDYLERSGQDLTFMRLLVVGSDRWYGQEYDQLQALCTAETRLINSYGVTEATIDSSYFERSTTARPLSAESLVPIGRPFANTQLYILDSSLQPVPIGVTGELHIGGAGVARGYLNRAQLTAARFVPNPFREGERLYKSGDLARYLPDTQGAGSGQIQLLGRMDYQVKIRGYRIELAEIEALLGQHEAVSQAVVAAHEVEAGHKRLVAYVMPDSPADRVDEETSDQWQEEYLAQWNAVFDDLYEEHDPEEQLGFYIKGWESSYTRSPMAAQEVRVWMDQTIERILALRPQRVLELGCGSGLTMFRVAPYCTSYHATDMSQEALNVLQTQLERSGRKLPVKLEQRAAHDFSGLEANSVDALVIVSVLQYFPNFDYLWQVLTGAVKVVQPGGFIFLSDVRSLPLLDAFHASVQLYQAADNLTLVQFEQQIQKQVLEEKQLVVDPAFFLALKAHLPQITHVEIQLERGHAHNELSKFRYDVILHIGHEEGSNDPSTGSGHGFSRLDWQTEKLTLQAVHDRLLTDKPDNLLLTHVPNARVATDLQVLQLLSNLDHKETVGKLRQCLQEQPTQGIEPEAFWRLGEEFSYHVNITWSDSAHSGAIDVLFRRDASVSVIDFPYQAPLQTQKPLHEWVNNPMQGELARGLVPRLRTFLQEKLPEYMVPAAFVELSALPLLPNGKINRRKLPAPEKLRSTSEPIVLPRTPTEEILAAIWADVLGIEQTSLGIHDNFFELGGDSILSIRIITRAKKKGLALAPKQLFEQQTIAELAQYIEKSGPPVPSSTQDDINHEVTTSSPSPIIGRGGWGVRADIPLQKELIEDVYPLSPLQEGLLFHTLYDQVPGMYLTQSSCLLHGPLNKKAFRAAWEKVVARHAALRTAFYIMPGEYSDCFLNDDKQATSPHQVVYKQVELPWQELDYGQKAFDLKQFLAKDRQQPFELSKAPLMRCTLIKVAPDRHRFIWSSHHILADGWSGYLIFKEVMAFYEAALRGEHLIGLGLDPPLGTQRPFRDYVMWLQQQDTTAAETFWRQSLRGVTAPTSLVVDKAGSVEREGNPNAYNEYDLRFSPALSAMLKATARQHHLTLNTLMQGAWAMLLSRYNNRQPDVLFGATVSSRPLGLSGIEATVGLLINTLPVRVHIAEEANLASWLKDLQREQVEREAYAHSSLVDIHGWSEIPRGTPLFESLLVFKNELPEMLTLQSPLQLSQLRVFGQNNYPLTLLIEPKEQVTLTLAYDTNRFERDTIRRMTGHLQTLLMAMASDLTQKIRQYSLLTLPETEQLLLDMHKTSVDYASRDDASRDDMGIHDFFTEQAARTAENEDQSAFVPPRNPIERKLSQLWQEVLGVSVGIQDNFFDVGGHSLLAIRLFARIQQQFPDAKPLPFCTLFQQPTIEQFARVLRQPDAALAWESLVPIQTKGNGKIPPLFCLPGIEGSVINLYQLARHLPDIPFYGLQAVGLDGTSPPYTTIEEMAAHYVSSIKTVQPTGPYCLAGHSFGGQVAFEMAQQLKRSGEEVALLALLDTMAPLAEPDDDSQMLDWQNRIQSLSPEAQLAEIQQQLQLTHLLPAEANSQLVAGMLRVIKSNAQIHYMPKQIIPIPITLFRAQEEIAHSHDSPYAGWDAFAPVNLHVVPGNHITMMKSPHVEVLARQLREMIKGILSPPLLLLGRPKANKVEGVGEHSCQAKEN